MFALLLIQLGNTAQECAAESRLTANTFRPKERASKLSPCPLLPLMLNREQIVRPPFRHNTSRKDIPRVYVFTCLKLRIKLASNNRWIA